MKKIRLFCIIFVCGLISVILVSCGKKTALTPNKFKTTLEGKGYTVTDTLVENTEKVFIAINSTNKYQIKFYKVGTESQAISAFNTNKSDFESQKGSISSEVSVELNNYGKYNLSTNTEYKVISRIDTTFIYVNAPVQFKDEIKTVLDSIGY